ncbi:glycoside hydrolase family 16 protein [Marinoscillum sp. MHG1-6]|uniref:glycoside hydrolase family 16 protein n=1 Tax=Marinoscillum sp. MHG1-6 TaxID=2959627 RepID=UPI00215845C9|nr:glycoside hydrolase family 16 protein [Marinoscillum sp. MHG1-6]
MNKVIKLLALALLVIITIKGCYMIGKNSEENSSKYTTEVWADEFDYAGLPDSTKWSYDVGDGCPDNCGWGNNELEYYTEARPKNARVEDGKLIIQLHKESFGSREYTSARLTTKGKGDWKYGRFEIRAKLPSGLGTWPALWMLPTDWKYGGWPESGEIDIIEKVGYSPDTVVAAAHTGAYNHGIGTHKNAYHKVADNDEAFHTYVLEWEEDEYRVYTDDELFFTFRNENKTTSEWPFNQRFHLLLNIAFGGNWGGKMGIDDASLPATMEIDYVRVFQ